MTDTEIRFLDVLEKIESHIHGFLNTERIQQVRGLQNQIREQRQKLAIWEERWSSVQKAMELEYDTSVQETLDFAASLMKFFNDTIPELPVAQTTKQGTT